MHRLIFFLMLLSANVQSGARLPTSEEAEKIERRWEVEETHSIYKKEEEESYMCDCEYLDLGTIDDIGHPGTICNGDQIYVPEKGATFCIKTKTGPAYWTELSESYRELKEVSNEYYRQREKLLQALRELEEAREKQDSDTNSQSSLLYLIIIFFLAILLAVCISKLQNQQ